MILNEREMKMAKGLARDIVRVEKVKEIERRRLESERRQQAAKEAFESLGRTIRNAQDAYMEGFYKPVSKALKSMRRGFDS